MSVASRWLLRLAWALLALPACAAARPQTEVAPPLIDLTLEWQLLAEPGARWGLAEALAHAQDFRPATPQTLAPGYTDKALWARLDLPPERLPAGTLWLALRMPRLERVELWQQQADGSWLAAGRSPQVAGLSVPHAQWPLDTLGASFPLQRPAAGGTLHLLLRQAGRSAPSWDASLCTPRQCRRANAPALWISSLMIGNQLLVMVGCGLLFLLWRQRAFLLLAGYACSYSLYEFCQQGWGYQLLWPESGDWALRSLNVLICLTQALQSMCIVALLRRVPRRVRAGMGLLWAAEGAALCLALWGDYRAVAPFANALNFIVSLLTVALALWGWRQRLPQAGALALTMVLTVGGTIPRYLHVFGLMSHGNPLMLTTPAILLATSLLMVWVLIERMATLNRARLQAQEHLLSERAVRERELEGLVAQRTAELAGSLKDAQQLHRQRTRLLAYIGHDLRAPLSATVSTLRQLGTGLVTGVEQHRLHGHIEQSVAYQLSLIDELLEFSHGELQALELLPEAIYAWSLLQELAAQGESLARMRGNAFSAHFAPDLPPVVLADAKRLRQLLLNLLSNAAKFTSGGHIELRVAAPGESRWLVEVIDDGIGIDTPRRGELEQGERSGLGLGLAIARHIVDAMGGEMTIQSTPGQGSRFSLDLPMPAARAEEVDLPGARFGPIAALAPGQLALLLDSPPAHADRVAELLFAANFDVQRITTVDGAGTLLLCDPALLDADGIAALAGERASSPRRALIGLVDRPPAPEVAALFDALLYKPLDPSALAAALSYGVAQQDFRTPSHELQDPADPQRPLHRHLRPS